MLYDVQCLCCAFGLLLAPFYWLWVTPGGLECLRQTGTRKVELQQGPGGGGAAGV